MDTRFIFSSTYSAWSKLSVHYNTDAITSTPQSSAWIRTVAPIANTAKKALAILAFAVCTIATGIFSLVVLPYRLYQWKTLEKQGLKQDYDRLSLEEAKELRTAIVNYIDEKEVKGKFKVPSFQKEEYIQKMMCYYARSSTLYGPVAVAWTEYLLDKANKDNKKLVFMARDGIAPYKMAVEMMQDEKYKQKYPSLVGEGQIQLGYLSRSVVNTAKSSPENKELFQKYMQQLGIQNGDECIFVDVGFTGSMIDDIHAMLPDVKVDFDFLISHTDKAAGFILSYDDPNIEQFAQLPTIESIPFKGAGKNPATHWLEDTHQGVQASAKYLVEVDGVIYPNTKNPQHKEYTVEKGSLDFLLRKWCQKAVVKSWKKYSTDTIDKKDAVRKLDETLNKIVNHELPLLIRHV